VSPRGKLATTAGVTAIEVANADDTVSVAVPETVPEVAVMLVLPAATACASPLVGEVLLTSATAVFEEVQVALPVKLCVLLSL
jgi:hypothetical protein